MVSADYEKLKEYLFQLNSYKRGAENNTGEDFKKIKDRARAVLSGDKYLLEKFDGFFFGCCSGVESCQPQADETTAYSSSSSN